MAQFYAEIQGQAGPVHRIGSKNSGIWSHTRGWNLGIEIYGHTTEDGEDEFEVWATGGSNGHRNRKMIGTLTKDGFGYAPPSNR